MLVALAAAAASKLSKTIGSTPAFRAISLSTAESILAAASSAFRVASVAALFSRTSLVLSCALPII